MTRQQAITILKAHQHWRRCNDDKCECEQQDTAELGRALDIAINALSESASLVAFIHKLKSYVLVFHRITNHNRIGKSYVTVEELHEINLNNQAITLDIGSKEWEV